MSKEQLPDPQKELFDPKSPNHNAHIGMTVNRRTIYQNPFLDAAVTSEYLDNVSLPNDDMPLLSCIQNEATRSRASHTNPPHHPLQADIPAIYIPAVGPSLPPVRVEYTQNNAFLIYRFIQSAGRPVNMTHRSFMSNTQILGVYRDRKVFLAPYSLNNQFDAIYDYIRVKREDLLESLVFFYERYHNTPSESESHHCRTVASLARTIETQADPIDKVKQLFSHPCTLGEIQLAIIISFLSNVHKTPYIIWRHDSHMLTPNIEHTPEGMRQGRNLDQAIHLLSHPDGSYQGLEKMYYEKYQIPPLRRAQAEATHETVTRKKRGANSLPQPVLKKPNAQSCVSSHEESLSRKRL